jgi:capsid protein
MATRKTSTVSARTRKAAFAQRKSPAIARGQPLDYEATKHSTSRTWLNLTGFDGAYSDGGAVRTKVSQISRYLYDNNPLVALAIGQIVNYVCPIIPQASTENPVWNTIAEDYFTNWAKRCDVTGRYNFWAFEEMACIALDVDGDVGFLAALDDSDPRLQLIEGFRIAQPKDSAKAQAYFDGVKLDNFGRVVGYHLDPNDSAADVDINQLKLIRSVERYSAYRGIGALRRGANDIRDHADIKAFMKLGAKIDSSIPAVIEGGPTTENEWGKDDAATSSDSAFDKTKGNMDLLAGNIPVLPAGQSIKAIETQRPSQNLIEFLDTLSGNMVAGLGVPPAFFLDAKLTGPNARSVNGKAQRAFQRRQRILADLVEWTWVRVIGHAIDNGRINAQKGWWRVAFQYPPALTIDAGREAQQERDDWASGLNTRQRIYGKQGCDWQREIDQSFSEDSYVIQKASELSQQTGIPVEQILARYGYGGKGGAPPVNPQQPQNNEPNNVPNN